MESDILAATITRNMKISGPDGTFGGISGPNGYAAATAERAKTGDHPCIPPPADFYLAELRYSAAHKDLDLGYGKGMVYGIKDVPGRTDIEIHPANWPFQLLGCVALGAAVASIQAPDGVMRRGVTSSIAACKAFYAAMRGRPFRLYIKEAV